LTLLVGVSGAGKTKVLKTIQALRAIAEGESIPGAQWEVTFIAAAGQRYLWRGAFQQIDRAAPAQIEEEELTLDGVPLIQRNAERILLRGQRTPRLSPHQSALKLLNQEEGVA